MDVVLGVAAKSLDAAYELAKALHGPHAWAWQEDIGLKPSDTSPLEAPEAAARLLLGHDSRTAYLLVATHATAEELLRAVNTASRQQQQHGQQVTQGQPASERQAAAAAAVVARPRSPWGGGGSSSSSSDDSSSGAAAVAVAVQPPPLLWLQQHHAVAVNAMLLQMFLVCNAVLVLLPTGGLGSIGGGSRRSGGGGGGGALAGITDWMCRLRLLQGAKRALYQSLRGLGGGGQAVKNLSSPLQPPAPAAPSPADRPSSAAAAAAAALSASASGAGRAGLDGLAQLQSWCGRRRPPVLFFVSPSDEVPIGEDPSASVASAPRNASQGPRSSSAPRAAAASTHPLDANSLLRNLLKRCRPVPLSSTRPDTSQLLCLLDPAALVLEPGPLVLEPAVVHATVLAALLGSEEDGGGGNGGGGGTAVFGLPAASEPLPAVIWRPGTHGLHRVTEPLAAALAAAAQEEEGGLELGTAAAVAAGGDELQHGGGGAVGGRLDGGGDGADAARRLCAGWMATARALFDAAWVAWRQAAGQPMDWVPPCMEAILRQAPGSAQAASFLEPAAAWLAAAGGGLAARLATELSREAADAALRQYMGAAPPRYPERVHATAVAAAVAALRAAAPPGPAAAAGAMWLRAACEAEWRRMSGRRQCSALSATGRPCTRPVHDSTEPHCSETTLWVTATTTGSSLVAFPDPFDLQVANASAELDDGPRVAAPRVPSPAASLPAAASAAFSSSGGSSGRTKGGKRGGGGGAAAEQSTGGASTPPPPLQQQQQESSAHSHHLVVAVAQMGDGSPRQCALGPWITVTRLGPASSYSERRGLANQPGLNGSCLYPLTLYLEPESEAGQRSGSTGRGGGGGGGLKGPSGGVSAVPRVTSMGSNMPSDAAAGAATAAGDSDSEAGVVLNEQSFPSLAEAAAVTHAGRQQQQQLVSGRGQRRGSKQQTAGKGGGADAVAAAATVTSANSERDRLARAWPYAHGSSGASASRAGTAAGGGGAGGGGGASGPSARGPRRGGRGGGPDSRGFPPLPNARDVRRVLLSYEYVTLDGRRFLATPQQLAAAGAATASRVLPRGGEREKVMPSPAGPAGPHQPSRKGSRPPHPNALAATGAAATAVATPGGVSETAAAAAIGGSGSSNGAASFLLQNDVPLYLQPPGLQSDPTAPTAQDGAAGWDPTPRRPGGLAQLRRIFVLTPPSASGEPLLAARPTVQFRILQPPQLPRDAAAAAGLLQRPLPHGVLAATDEGVGGGDMVRRGAERTAEQQEGTTNGSGVVAQEEAAAAEEQGLLAGELVSGQSLVAPVVQVSLARPVPLPPDSLLVMSLPLLYGLPVEWLGWGMGLGEGKDRGGAAVASAGSEYARISVDNTSKDPQHAEIAAPEGAVSGTEGLMGATRGVGGSAYGQLLPLVQLDERTPFEACLLAGSALFPIPAGLT